MIVNDEDPPTETPQQRTFSLRLPPPLLLSSRTHPPRHITLPTPTMSSLPSLTPPTNASPPPPSFPSLPSLADLTLHSPSSHIIGTPFATNSIRFEYPFPESSTDSPGSGSVSASPPSMHLTSSYMASSSSSSASSPNSTAGPLSISIAPGGSYPHRLPLQLVTSESSSSSESSGSSESSTSSDGACSGSETSSEASTPAVPPSVGHTHGHASHTRPHSQSHSRPQHPYHTPSRPQSQSQSNPNSYQKLTLKPSSTNNPPVPPSLAKKRPHARWTLGISLARRRSGAGHGEKDKDRVGGRESVPGTPGEENENVLDTGVAVGKQ